ncbi:MAG TPA: SPOR domain-containing protein, partial [Candidatus Kapabacteria bacterium]|nr:SPOR domain-containing protein [Candidatus Kapabacteria bacterium]
KDGVVPVALRIVPADTVTGPEMAAIDENPGQKIETPEKKVKEVMAKKVKTKETGKPAIASTGSPQAKFYIQAGAFSEKENAQKMLNNMKTIFAHVSFDIYFQNGMYKVISSPQPTRAKAEELKKTLKTVHVDAFIKETI